MHTHAEPEPPALVERLRAVHLQMMDAVLGGEGLARVAQLASEAAGGPVAVVVPRLGVCALAPDGPEPDGLRAWVSDLVKDRASRRPGQVLADVPGSSGDELVVATIAGEHPGALAQNMEAPGTPSRVYALLPAAGADDAPERTLAGARRLATRLQRHGTVGLSSFYGDPAELQRAIQEAELVLDVLKQSDAPIAEDIGTGTYRLLFRVLASHPEEVRSFYDDTVAPIVRYDAQYRTDLVGTLEAYLDQNCNMNATAAAIYAHRHTVAYRLERVPELSALEPMLSEHRERLGLGLKAYRIIWSRLPR